MYGTTNKEELLVILRYQQHLKNRGQCVAPMARKGAEPQRWEKGGKKKNYYKGEERYERVPESIEADIPQGKVEILNVPKTQEFTA